MSMQTVLDFLKSLFTTDTGAINWLMIAASAVAAVYTVMMLLMPFAIWRMRRENIRLHKLADALLKSSRETESILCAIADINKDNGAALRRLSRALGEKRAAAAPAEETHG